MKLQETGIIQRQAAKLTTELLKDPAVRERLAGVPEERKQWVTHAKAASTYVGIGLAAFGFGGGSAMVVATFLMLKYRVIEGLPMTGLCLAVAGFFFLLGIAGAVNISKDLKDSLGWVALFLKSIVSIFRKLPNEPAPPSA